MRIDFVGTILVVLLSGRPLAAAQVSLAPTKDNTIVQWSPATPGLNPLLSNGKGDLFVGRSNDDGQEPPTISIRRGLVQFDVSAAVPSGAEVTSVVLTLRNERAMNGDRAISLHRVLANWGEGDSYFNGGQATEAADGDATWLHTVYNASTPSASPTWTTPGGDFVSAASAETIVADDFGDGHSFTWTGPGMVADVQAWVDGSATNFGWLLRGDEANGRTAKRFDSHDTVETNVAPTLLIEFDPAFAGDYNDDGLVDAADYTVWRDHFGESVRLPNETASIGTVTSADYAVWKGNFGAVKMEGGIGGSSSVPEPGSGILSTLGLAGALIAPRRVVQH